MISALLYGACGPSGPTSDPTTPAPVPVWMLTEPVLSPVDPNAPLGLALDLATATPSQVTVQIDDDPTLEVAFHAAATAHHLPLILLPPDRDTTLTVTVSEVDGPRVEVRTFDLEPLPPPPILPTVVVDIAQPEEQEPGWTWIGAGRSGTESGAEGIYLIDPQGRVVWVRETATDVIDVKMDPNGGLYGLVLGEAARWDLFGQRIAAWTAAANTLSDGLVITDTVVHHELSRLADGSWLTLASVPRTVPSFPTNYGSAHDRAEAVIADEHVLHFTDDGTVLDSWSLADRLDDERIGYNSLLERLGLVDWGHANAVSEHVDDGGLLVSLRHQDTVVELDPVSGELRWILANPDNWTPDLDAFRLQPVDPDFSWFYHPHAPEWTSAGTLVLFDNGNERASPFTDQVQVPDADNTSRVLELAIDETTGQFDTVWSFDAPPPGRMFSNREGDVDRLPTTGNILSLWGSVGWIDGVPAQDVYAFGTDMVFLIETTHTNPPRTVGQMRIGEPSTSWAAGWSANRAERTAQPYGSLATVTVR